MKIRKLVTIALVIEYEEDFPRYSEEERDKEFSRDPKVLDLINSPEYMRDIGNEASEPQTIEDWVNDNLTYYFGGYHHPEREPQIIDSVILVDDVLEEAAP